jgi:hypothetical protein
LPAKLHEMLMFVLMSGSFRKVGAERDRFPIVYLARNGRQLLTGAAKCIRPKQKVKRW